MQTTTPKSIPRLKEILQRLKWSILGLPLLLCTCDPAPKPAPLPDFGTAAAPAVYADFAAVESLFHQRSDTTYVVNFWATWCKPCREEIPLLQKLGREEGDQKVRVVLVSLDTEPGAIARIPAFLGEVAPDLPAIVLTDENDAVWGKTIDRVWSGALPTTIIYRGELRYVYRRDFSTYVDLRTALDPLIGR